MKVDRYTKFVLTIIAVGLWALVINGIIAPQPAVAGSTEGATAAKLPRIPPQVGAPERMRLRSNGPVDNASTAAAAGRGCCCCWAWRDSPHSSRKSVLGSSVRP